MYQSDVISLQNTTLSSHALAEHERQHPQLAPPRVQRARRSTVDFSSSDKSSDTCQKKKPQMSKRAFDVTRRLSVSSALFSQLQQLTFAQEGGGGGHGPDAKYEPTYHTEPKEDEKFIAKEVSDIMQRALQQKLRDVTYDAGLCAKFSCSLTNIIKSRIQENLDLPRYKVVVNVVIGENKGQSLQMASRCLWNDATDRCATSCYQNRSLFAVATAHGVYFDW